MFIAGKDSPIKNTTYKVVLPFYMYASVSFLIAALLVFFNTQSFTQHYFSPATLAITHVMALGWGTMIILGASHQLFPVMIEGKLYSERLAYLSFYTAAIGIPMLVTAFYNLEMGVLAKSGAVLVNIAVVAFAINLLKSMLHSKSKNVHAVFAITSVVYLFFTTFLGLILVWNFSTHFLSANSLYYLSLHAHLGIIGWFLLMVVGVGSRLIPMFLISKYENHKQLWYVYGLLNSALLLFVGLFFSDLGKSFYALPILMGAVAIFIFANYIYKSYRLRIRKKVDAQVKISMLSVLLIAVPIVVLSVVIMMLATAESVQLITLYGFTIFFGWITAIILGMTFKTLPFIVWNKVYSKMAGKGKTPNPKELFNQSVFRFNSITFLGGFVVFALGILLSQSIILKIGALFLVINAILYNFNVFRILFHKSQLK